jgi:hypothetical protein
MHMIYVWWSYGWVESLQKWVVDSGIGNFLIKYAFTNVRLISKMSCGLCIRDICLMILLCLSFHEKEWDWGWGNSDFIFSIKHYKYSPRSIRFLKYFSLLIDSRSCDQFTTTLIIKVANFLALFKTFTFRSFKISKKINITVY